MSNYRYVRFGILWKEGEFEEAVANGVYRALFAEEKDLAREISEHIMNLLKEAKPDVLWYVNCDPFYVVDTNPPLFCIDIISTHETEFGECMVAQHELFSVIDNIRRRTENIAKIAQIRLETAVENKRDGGENVWCD